MRNFILANRHKLSHNNSFKPNARSAKLVLQTTVIAAIFGLIILILDLSYLNFSSALVDLGLVLAAVCSFYLITKGNLNIAKLILVFSALTAVTINASKDGFNAGNQYFWFAILGGIFAFFSFKEKKMLIVCLFFLLITLVFCDLTNFSYLMQKTPSTNYIFVNHHVVLYLSFFSCIFFIIFIAKSIFNSFQDKDKDNARIEKQKFDAIEANRQLDKFVYHASHDLRAPLTSMLGLIAVSKKEGTMDKINKLLSKQEETILKLDDYIKDILVLSRIKPTEINATAINLSDHIDGILKQCQFMLEEKNIIVNTNLNVDAPFFTDGKRLNIVLANLLSNGIKYADASKPANTIDITAILNKENNLIISIKDNGVGIAANELEKVFEMFYSSSYENKGTGLGLYIVQETVSRMRGTVTIKSDKGIFTTVEVILPNLSA